VGGYGLCVSRALWLVDDEAADLSRLLPVSERLYWRLALDAKALTV